MWWFQISAHTSPASYPCNKSWTLPHLTPQVPVVSVTLPNLLFQKCTSSCLLSPGSVVSPPGSLFDAGIPLLYSNHMPCIYHCYLSSFQAGHGGRSWPSFGTLTLVTPSCQEHLPFWLLFPSPVLFLKVSFEMLLPQKSHSWTPAYIPRSRPMSSQPFFKEFIPIKLDGLWCDYLLMSSYPFNRQLHQGKPAICSIDQVFPQTWSTLVDSFLVNE